DLGYCRFEAGFDDPVELDALPGRDSQRAVRVPVGERIEREILPGREPSARDADAHHELPDLVLAALLALGGTVAVITLINSVEFEERIALVVEWLFGIREVAGDMSAQLAALMLDRLGLRNRVDLNHIVPPWRRDGIFAASDVVQVNTPARACQLSR